MPMSRTPHHFGAALSGPVGALILVCVLMAPAASGAGVIVVKGDTYSLDGGSPVTGMWEIAEKVAYAKDAAIIVLAPDAGASSVQALLRLLESLKVPTILTKKQDYNYLVAHGILHPSKTP